MNSVVRRQETTRRLKDRKPPAKKPPPPKDARDEATQRELQRLEGTWIPVDVEHDGDKLTNLATPGNPDAPQAVHEGPIDQSWGTREFYVDDPDDNTLRFTEGFLLPPVSEGDAETGAA